ncbi:Riboflavin kinase [Phycisphaerae bacterium RAS1]|nr:Riboflavin kinase [Phycisphaerae bacterium RAS1]
MITLQRLEEYSPTPAGAVVSIGNFDGVHRGHAAILLQARVRAAELRARQVVITFEPHPMAVLAPQRAPARLTRLEDKLRLLAEAGVDACIVLKADAALLSLEAEAFLDLVVTNLRPRAFVEGPDFNFGRGRGGSVETLRAAGDRLGFAVTVVAALHCDELPGRPTISSSSIRTALAEGRVADARRMLGRPHRVTGRVGHGQNRGAALGFPTANLVDVEQVLPGHAVYAAVAELPDGRRFAAAVNVGPQPTFGQDVSRVEAHLIGFSGGLRGASVGLGFVERIRGQQKFGSIDALAAQIREDVRQIARVVEL